MKGFFIFVKKHKKASCVIGMVLVVAIVAGIILYRNSCDKKITNFNPEFEENQEQDNTEAGGTAGIRIPGYSTITVAANTKDVSIDLENPEDNNVYFEISFYLPDTDETIYTSKLISPGQHVYNLTMNRALEAGEYPLTIQYATYSMDDSYSPRNGAEVNCTLRAE